MNIAAKLALVQGTLLILVILAQTLAVQSLLSERERGHALQVTRSAATAVERRIAIELALVRSQSTAAASLPAVALCDPPADADLAALAMPRLVVISSTGTACAAGPTNERQALLGLCARLPLAALGAAARQGRPASGLCWSGEKPWLVGVAPTGSGQLALVPRPLEDMLAPELPGGTLIALAARGRLLLGPAEATHLRLAAALVAAVKEPDLLDPWHSGLLTSFRSMDGQTWHLARSSIPALGALGAQPAEARWWLMTRVSAAADASDLMRRAGGGLAAALVLLLASLRLSVRRLVTDPMQEAARSLDRLSSGDLSVKLVNHSGDESGVLSESVNRMATALEASRQREAQWQREDAERQTRSILALEDLERAETCTAAGDLSKALEHLSAIPDNLGGLSRKARLMRIDVALKQQDELTLETDLMRGDLACFPPKTLRHLAAQMEAIMRFDLALECLRVMDTQKPGQSTIRSRISRLQGIVVERGDATLMMQTARKALGRQFYEIRYLQSGGMGLVVRARQRNDSRLVAVKILPPAYAADLELNRRFKREIRSLMMLDHPNVVKVLGEVEGEISGYSMELLDGQDLEQYFLNRLPLPLAEAAALVVKMLSGLHHAHDRGVLHRDVKPANFLRLADGEIKLVDFGLAKVEDTTTMTALGSRMGTPAYMAPEQMKGASDLGESADVYSMGVIVFEMLSGQRPFSDSTDLVSKVFEAAPKLHSVAPNVPGDVADVVDLCLARDPRMRRIRCPQLSEVLSRHL